VEENQSLPAQRQARTQSALIHAIRFGFGERHTPDAMNREPANT